MSVLNFVYTYRRSITDLRGGFVNIAIAHTAGSTIEKITISYHRGGLVLLMEYAASLRVAPFAAQNHTANTPALPGASRSRFSPILPPTLLTLFRTFLIAQ